jgi:membrane-bound ClpP family serine protease
VKKLDGKELETVASMLTLIGGLLEFIVPLDTIYNLAQNVSTSSFPILETLLAILAIVGCVIIWKGASLAGGVMGIIVGILILQSFDFKYRTLSGVLIIIGGIVALAARLWRGAKSSPDLVKRL